MRTVHIAWFIPLFILLMLFLTNNAALAYNQTWILDKIQSTWTTDNGFPVNGALDILQSSEGYMWIGTYDGLVRFDGINFKLFNKYSVDGFDCSSARILYEDNDNRLWIGTNESGIAILQNGTFKTLSTKDGLPGNSIRCITGDNKGTVLVGTSQGMAAISCPNISSTDTASIWPIEELNDYSIIDIMVDSDGFIWAVTQQGNIYVNKGLHFSKFHPPDIFQDDRVQKMFEDSRGNIWFGTINGNIICRSTDNHYQDYTGKAELSTYYINDIFEDQEGVIWFCSDQGLTCLDENEFTIFTEEDSLINNSVESICQDHEGSLWVASSRAGIQKVSYGKFINYSTSRGLGDDVVNVITKDHTGMYWIGTDKGLSLLKNNRFIDTKLTALLQDIRIRHIYEDSQNHIWISTYSDYGLILYKDGQITSINIDDGLSANTVRVVFEDSQHNIWVGTKAGLNLLKDNKVQKVYHQSDGLADDYILCINETAQGEILLGTDGGGLSIIKGDLIRHYTQENGLGGNIVFKILSDNRDRTWIVNNQGISLWEDGTFFNYTVKDGLLSDAIFDIVPDNEGRFWFTCSKGVFSIRRDDMIKYARGQIIELPLQIFDKADGLLDGITPASWSTYDNNGKIWFATTQGVSAIDTSNIHMNRIPPKIVVEEVQTDNNIYLPWELTSIDPQNKRINIRFSGLSFAVPDKVLFKYYLEGFDSHWSSPTSSREVSYTNLPYGHYTFHVMAANNDGIWSEDNDSVSFFQKPVFYETKAFNALVCLLIIAAIYAVNKLTMIRVQKRKEEIRNILIDAITALVSTIDAKDSYTNGHSKRVCEYSMKIGKAMEMSEDKLEQLEYMALLHDVGKIGIRDSILNKETKLSDDEYKIMQQHPEIGANILSQGKSLEEIAVGAKYHHERYDGKGYCTGLKGDEIPLEARIIAVADAYDAMLTKRPYRKSLGHSAAVEEINRCSGTQFDPNIVKYFNMVFGCTTRQ